MKFINKNLLILAAILFLMIPLTTRAQVAVIANKSIKAKSIDNNTLTNLYTLQSKEIGSQKVKLYFLTGESETGKKFLSSINMSLPELNKIWLRAKLTGQGNAPEFVSSESALREKVALTPDAIGFIEHKNASGDVKVLLLLH